MAGRSDRATARIRDVGLAALWIAAAALVALGAAGLVAAVGASPGTPGRAELTWAGDRAIAPHLEAATVLAERLSAEVDDLGTAGRVALAALVARDRDLLARTLAEGSRIAVAVEAAASQLRSEVRSLPGVSGLAPDPLPPTSELLLGVGQRRSVELLLRAADLAEDLDRTWRELTGGALPAIELMRLLEDHDTSTAAAAADGRAGRYPDAIAALDRSIAILEEARALRDELANRVDVSVLDEWLDRNAAYDAALRSLYEALRRSGGRVTDEVRDAFAAERAAKERLPPDTRGLVVIMAEIARGGLNQAVIAIEEAKGGLLDALDELEAIGSPAPS
jgi:tetratricopeptide (TPR) repeat protein